MTLAEDHCVLLGRTLVDASSWSASVLMVNPSSEVVVLPSFSCVGDLVPVSAVSVARSELCPPEMDGPLPDHLEDIVGGSHPFLGEIPAAGEPVTGRTTSVQHEIMTTDTRPVRCGPQCLAPAVLRTERTCIKEMLEGGQIGRPQ